VKDLPLSQSVPTALRGRPLLSSPTYQKASVGEHRTTPERLLDSPPGSSGNIKLQQANLVSQPSPPRSSKCPPLLRLVPPPPLRLRADGLLFPPIVGLRAGWPRPVVFPTGYGRGKCVLPPLGPPPGVVSELGDTRFSDPSQAWRLWTSLRPPFFVCRLAGFFVEVGPLLRHSLIFLPIHSLSARSHFPPPAGPPPPPRKIHWDCSHRRTCPGSPLLLQ